MKLTFPAIRDTQRALSVCLGFSLLLGACQVSPTGSLRFHLSVPQDSGASQFAVRAIPDGTTAFKIHISGEGLSSALIQRFEMVPGKVQVHTIANLPPGTKKVLVQALLQEQVLAEASQTIEIKTGELKRVEFELAALIQAVKLKLDTPLPLDLDLDLEVSGEGLSESFQKKLTLKADETELDLGVLPAGKKEAKVRFRTRIEGKEIASEVLTESFQVSENGAGTLNLPISGVLESYTSQLELLLSRLSPLQILAILSQLTPEQLRQLLERLPKALKERLLANPLVRARLTEAR